MPARPALVVTVTGEAFVLAGQPTATATALAEVARARGMEVIGADDQPIGDAAHWYGGPLAADAVAGRFGVALLEPADQWLPGLPTAYLGRAVRMTTMASAWELAVPAFVKSPSDKQLPAAVYRSGADLPRSGPRIGPATPVLVADPVAFACEFRLFVLDGAVVTGSRYLTDGRLDPVPLSGDRLRRDVEAFAAEMLADLAPGLPSAVVVDVGRIEGGPWAVVEANMAWFAQRYQAGTTPMFEVVLRAAGPRVRVAARDEPFLRRQGTLPAEA